MYDLTELLFKGSVFLLWPANKSLIVNPYIKKSRQQYKVPAAFYVVRNALSVQFLQVIITYTNLDYKMCKGILSAWHSRLAEH